MRATGPDGARARGGDDNGDGLYVEHTVSDIFQQDSRGAYVCGAWSLGDDRLLFVSVVMVVSTEVR